jgi:hypothetical protein
MAEEEDLLWSYKLRFNEWQISSNNRNKGRLKWVTSMKDTILFSYLVHFSPLTLTSQAETGCNTRFLLTVPCDPVEGIFILERGSSCSLDWVTFMNDWLVSDGRILSEVLEKVISTIVRQKNEL